MLLLAKTSQKSKVKHCWKETENEELFSPICNPGIIRMKAELFNAGEKDALCKVCWLKLYNSD